MKKYSKKMIKKIKERLDTSNQLKDGVQLALEMGKKIKELTKENIELKERKLNSDRRFATIANMINDLRCLVCFGKKPKDCFCVVCMLQDEVRDILSKK